MQIEVSNKLITLVVTIVSAAFGVYLFFNSIYIENHEMEVEKTTLNNRLLMSESTRYAQIAKYYRDEMKERELTAAEQSRLELVEREQCRIRTIISENSEVCE
jgi:hypothetical protein